MLHSIILKIGNKHDVQLAEWIWNGRIVFHPAQRLGVQLVNGFNITIYLGRIVVAIVNGHLAISGWLRSYFELTTGKSKQVGAYWLGFFKNING